MKITKEGIAVIENDTHISKWVEETGRLDHDQSALRRILPYINKGDTVIDCGAFIGDHTIAYAKKVCEEGLIIAIEANREAFECLEYNMHKVRNKILYKMAVSNVLGEYGLVKENNSGASHLTNHSGSIRSLTIDSLDLDRCDFIKMDIEGFEVKALEGASRTIRQFQPVLVIEINEGALSRQGNTEKDIFQYLDNHNYSYTNIYPDQKMEGPQYDIICVKK